ncbi:MAG: STAS domain-containing protein [Planctomycetota bacterium]
MIPDPSEAKFDLAGETLNVSGDLGTQDEKELARALESLFDTDAEIMVVDLTGVRYLSSSYVRHVAMLAIRARQKERSVVVRAHERVVRILKMGGLDKIATIEVIRDE